MSIVSYKKAVVYFTTKKNTEFKFTEKVRPTAFSYFETRWGKKIIIMNIITNKKVVVYFTIQKNTEFKFNKNKKTDPTEFFIYQQNYIRRGFIRINIVCIYEFLPQKNR